MEKLEIALIDLKDTEYYASVLAKIAEIGDIITFSGDLGVGKTSFIQSFVKSLSSYNKVEQEIEVTSPTFNLLHVYDLKKYEVWHFDLYRLKSKQEIYELGIEDAFNSGVSLIEWPEIIEGMLPKDRLEIKMSFREDYHSRLLTLIAYGKWKEKLLLGLGSSVRK